MLDQLKRKKKRHSTRRRGTRAGVCVRVGKEFHLMRTQQFSLVEYIEVENLIFCRVSMPDSARSRSQMNRLNHSHLHSVCLQTLVESNVNVKSSQVTFIYIAPLTIQIVTKHCTISK